MAEKRRGLGKGLGALIPAANADTPASTSVAERPVDVFFPGSARGEDDVPRETKLHMTPRRSKKKTTSTRDSAIKGKTQSVDVTEDAADQAPETKEAKNAKPAAASKSTKSKTVKSGAKTAKAGKSKASTNASNSAVPQSEGDRSQEAPEKDKSDTAESVESVETSDKLVPVPGATFANLAVGDIAPNPQQPRKVFDAEDMAELVHSIREIGVLQPIVVRPLPSGTYELIMGERRWRASQAAGQPTVPAIIRQTADTDLLRDALLENLHRSELNALEEAAAYEQLLSDFSCTHEELASRIGRSRPQITNMVRLLRLPGPVQKRLTNGQISTGHARALLSLKTHEQMVRVSDRVIIDGLSVRATEELVASLTEPPEEGTLRRRRSTGEFGDLAGRLSTHFETKVAIAMGKKKGKVTLEFQNEDELQRLLDKMAPGEGMGSTGQ